MPSEVDYKVHFVFNPSVLDRVELWWHCLTNLHQQCEQSSGGYYFGLFWRDKIHAIWCHTCQPRLFHSLQDIWLHINGGEHNAK